MPQETYPDVPPDFGHWLAGFIDGEGCFLIDRGTRLAEGGFTYAPSFRIAQRIDNREILEDIVARTGLGRIVDEKQPRKIGQRRADWRVTRKHEVGLLMDLVARFPPRSRKEEDFWIWREAVLAWQAVEPGCWVRRSNWSTLERLKSELEAARRFREPVGHP